MRPRSSSQVAWHRRLSFRLAILMAATMLAFAEFSPLIYRQVLNLLDQPDLENLWVVETERIRDGLLDGALRGGPGRWRPLPEAVLAFSAELEEEGVSFVWLDTGGRVLACGQEPAFRIGQAWPFPLETYQLLDLSGGSSPGLPALTFPISLRGEAAGTLVKILIDREQHSEIHGIAPENLEELEECQFAPLQNELLLTEQQYEAAEVSKSRIVRGSSIVIVSLAVLLFAFVTSRLVTRRLTRLARMVGRGAHEVPGPFPSRGQDEIALLSRSMNDMRERVLALVEGVQRRDRERREWVAQVSHDLRTPLTALLAGLDRSEERLKVAGAEQLRAEVREVIAVARMDALRVLDLADDLLEIGRLDAGDGLTLEPVPPGELVRQTVRALGPLADDQGIRLSVEVESGLPILNADGRRLMRALENLLKNAIHHGRKSVIVGARRVNGALRFEVRDDGSGLPEGEGGVVIAKLLGLRSRDDSAGLGLDVAGRVAKAHGGRLGAKNAESGGARVWLELPVEGPLQ